MCCCVKQEAETLTNAVQDMWHHLASSGQCHYQGSVVLVNTTNFTRQVSYGYQPVYLKTRSHKSFRFSPYNYSISAWRTWGEDIIIHYNSVIMSAMAYQITSLTIVYSTVYSGADQRKHQSYVSLAFVRGIHRWLVNSPHKEPVMRKTYPYDDAIIIFPGERDILTCVTHYECHRVLRPDVPTDSKYLGGFNPMLLQVQPSKPFTNINIACL